MEEPNESKISFDSDPVFDNRCPIVGIDSAACGYGHMWWRDDDVAIHRRDGQHFFLLDSRGVLFGAYQWHYTDDIQSQRFCTPRPDGGFHNEDTGLGAQAGQQTRGFKAVGYA
jgi:hypothetical protein